MAGCDGKNFSIFLAWQLHQQNHSMGLDCDPVHAEQLAKAPSCLPNFERPNEGGEELQMGMSAIHSRCLSSRGLGIWTERGWDIAIQG